MDPDVVHNESIGQLIRGILTDVRALIEEELAMARLEISHQAARARTAAISLGVAVVALLCAGVLLLVALATAVADLLGWPTWAGFLVVAALMGVIGLATLASSRKKLHAVQVVPEKTIATLKENAAWISKRLSSARK
jgi:uncharacterized protein (DUF983 family)